MGCATCANNDGSGTPTGCKNNGTCASGGCNKLEVFDWLSDMELPAGQTPFGHVEVRFKNSRKDFYRNTNNIPLHTGDVVAVEGGPGTDIGVVSLTGELVRVQMGKKGVNFDSNEIRKIYRVAEERDIEKWQEARSKERATMLAARKMAADLGLVMKISDVEYQGDGNKVTFFYTAEERVDFRQLIKVMADEFKCRIEMRQIGARQEASRIGGIGSCGRELCCTTWLTDFRSVSTSAARYQQLSLNPQKLAGQCGKLKCCLNYELDGYLEAFKEFPSSNTKLRTKKGPAFCMKIDIFKRTMYFMYEQEAVKSPIGLSLDRVLEIIEKNKDGKEPDDLRDYVEIEVVEEPDYDNVVGQDSLTRFDGLMKKKRKKKRKKPGDSAQGGGSGEARAGGNNRNRGRGKGSSGGARAQSGEGGNRRGRGSGKPKGAASGKKEGQAKATAEGGQKSRGDGQQGSSKGRSNQNRRRGGRGRGPKPEGNASAPKKD